MEKLCLIDQCIAIRRRTNMFYSVLARLDSYMLPLNDQLEKIIATEGTDYSMFSLESKISVAAAASMAGSIKAVLDTTILNADGELTEESKMILEK